MNEGSPGMTEHRTMFEAPKYVGVLLGHMHEKIARNYWRTHQQTWDGFSDPEIEAITWRPIQTMSGEKGVRFSFEGVDLRWIGQHRQQLTANVSWSTQEWNAWFERLMVWIGS